MGILARSEICQKCARCCKSFTISGFQDDTGFKKRIDWMESNTVTMDKEFNLKINISCIHLKSDGKLYSCAIHKDPHRPQLCRDYPDNVPFSSWEIEAENCPILKEKLALINSQFNCVDSMQTKKEDGVK
jgi:Fe-S-cluster containining protein